MDGPAPESFQPRLTWWGQTWRLLLTLSISAILWLTYAEVLVDQAPVLFYVDLVAGLAAYVLVFFRRRWPLTIAVATNLLGAVSGIAQGPGTLAAVSLATWRRLTHVALVAALAIAVSTVFTETQPESTSDPAWISFIAASFAIAASMGWGMYIGSRRELLWTLRQRAERAEAEQELRVAQSRSTERARIAREMHDVLAHRISQISMQAGALSFREDLDADQLRDGAAVIRTQAHAALTDLRDVLGVLRDDGTATPLDAPQPTYADVPELVAECRAAGMVVTFDDEVAGDEPMPDVVGRTVYRIVQEGLTNARKHAPGARVVVRASGRPERGVEVTLRNALGFGPTATPGSGLGLVGLTERAALRGGRLEHRADRGVFVLRAWLPWTA